MSEGEGKLYFSIAEASSELELPKYVIRFWEGKFHQISPMKRAGGRRFFRNEDMQILRLVKFLLHQNGLTIKGAQNLLKRHPIRSLLQNMQDGKFEENIMTRSSSANVGGDPVLAKPTAHRFLRDLLHELKSIRQLVD